MTSETLGPHIFVVRLVMLIRMPFSEDVCFSAVLKGVESRTCSKGSVSGFWFSLVSGIMYSENHSGI